MPSLDKPEGYDRSAGKGYTNNPAITTGNSPILTVISNLDKLGHSAIGGTPTVPAPLIAPGAYDGNKGR